MSQTALVTTPIEPTLKVQAETLLQQAGFTVNQAITLFYQQIVVWQGQLPFASHPPNPVTAKTFQDTDAGKHLVHCQDAEEMFRKLGI